MADDETTTPDNDEIIKRVGYQRAGQVRQALAELTTAKTQGNTERVKAANKTLAALGYAEGDGKPEVRRDKPPQDRTAPSERASTTGPKADEPKAAEPAAGAPKTPDRPDRTADSKR